MSPAQSYQDDDEEGGQEVVLQEQRPQQQQQAAAPAAATAEPTDQTEQAVRWTRYLVVTVFCLTAVVVGSMTYTVMSHEEDQDYQYQYEQSAHEVLRVASDKARTTVQMTSHMARLYNSMSLTTTTTTTSSSSNADDLLSLQELPPYVTLPNFEAFGQRVRQGSHAVLLAYTPYLTSLVERGEWIQHAAAHNDWIAAGQALAVAASDAGSSDTTTTTTTTNSASSSLASIDTQIWTYNEAGVRRVDLQGPIWTPLWQMSPPPLNQQHQIQLNLATHSLEFAALLQSVRRTGLDTLSQPMDMTNLFGYNANGGGSSHNSVATTTDDSTTAAPSSILMQPVYLHHPAAADQSSEFVGAMSAVVPWTVYFDNVLHEGTNGIQVVVDSCGQNNTYTINGNAVRFDGAGDLHSQAHNHMVVSGQLQYRDNEDDNNNMENGQQQQEEFCPHMLYIFPSQDFEDTYITWDPIIYSAVAIGMIAFSALVFLAYDISVTQRQKKTQRWANRTNALVAQLFPGAVRDLLFAKSDNRMGDTADMGGGGGGGGGGDPAMMMMANASSDDIGGGNRGRANSTAAPSTDGGGGAADAKHSFVSQGEARGMGDRPIAELFPSATVLYCDIAGFTAWSSIREPQHVFTLLESIFGAFDEIAGRYGVFKVETIGDCYVAVVGVPEPCEDHAVVMAAFARDCLDRFTTVVAGLELALGPDTSDLAVRIGIHSGPVTAGVLRGDRARFQLFGDTINVVAKIESSGQRECIHLSQTTADLIAQAGHTEWITPRADLVETKDMGVMETFWLKTNTELSMGSHPSGSVVDEEEEEEILDEMHQEELYEEEAHEHHEEHHEEGGFHDSKEGLTSHAGSSVGHTSHGTGGTTKGAKRKKNRKSALKKKQAQREKRIRRLVDWNCELLAQLLRQVVARREVVKSREALLGGRGGRRQSNAAGTNPATLMLLANSMGGNGHQVVEEVAEIVTMPGYDGAIADPDYNEMAAEVDIPDEALAQLQLFVSTIASMYRNNPFHNFEHASHVTMSVSKLLARIVSPSNSVKSSPYDRRSEEEKLHEHTYGIATDPLTQFTVVLSALIHDVDHRGVPNFVLAVEDKTLGAAYKGKSIAEQNSVDLAWNALMSEGFEDLRKCIFTDETELRRFRQLLVNSVIATDIFDRDLGMARKKRWKKAFDPENNPTSVPKSALGGVIMHGGRRSSTGSMSFGASQMLGMSFGNGMDDGSGLVQHPNEIAIDMSNMNNASMVSTTTEQGKLDRRATIVIEHLIQASDVAHTMQHFVVYSKWNEKLFAEMYESFLSGRQETDPSIKWYESELGFFDNYIIPLAKKLKECGVFGVASDEYLNYAQENRAEWALKGEEIVAKYLEKYS